MESKLNKKIVPSYNKNRVILGECLPLDAPFSVVLDVSEKCNFRCSYCFRSSKPSDLWSYARSNSLMSMETFELAARQLLSFPSQPKTIALSGHGEPLCNPLLPRMVKRLKGLGLTSMVDIHTNGSLLTPETAAALAESCIDRIIVSLQGINAETYKKVCGVTIDFDKFYENLKILYEQKNIKTTIHIKTVDAALSSPEEEERFYAIFSQIADYVFVEKVVPLWKAKTAGQNSKLNKYGESFGFMNYCSFLFYNLAVIPDGTIYPCLELPPPVSLGNIRETSLLDAWQSSVRNSFLKQHLQNGRKNHPCCRDCFVPQNTIKVKEDIITPRYRDIILERLE
jgi:radical SAM protein with 4Fe4S-binding SPASM domain